MNLNKSVLFPIKNCDLLELDNIPVKNSLTYLGVVIDKNVNNCCNLNYDAITQQECKRLNMWLMRNLSLNGRVLLSKAEGISASALAMPPTECKNLDKTLFNFIWKNKCHYLKRGIVCNPKSRGGMEVLSFETLNNTFKVKWLLNLIKENENIWSTFQNMYLMMLVVLNS